MCPTTTLRCALACNPDRLREFMADPLNWPSWAVPPCDGIMPLPDGSWRIDSPAGAGSLAVAWEGDTLVFRERFDEGEWLILCQIHAMEAGAELVVRIPRPRFCHDDIFDDLIEMAGLRLRRLQEAIDH